MKGPEHPFHKIIGDIFNDENFPFEGIRILKDTACGGDHTLPLFCSEVRSYATRYTCVDLMIVKEGKIKVIIEIEESNVKPLHLFGKYLASAMAKYYIYGREKTGMDKSVVFIQILDTSKQKSKSARNEQWENVKMSIQSIIPVKGSSMKEYKIFSGNQSDFISGDKKGKLINFVKSALR